MKVCSHCGRIYHIEESGNGTAKKYNYCPSCVENLSMLMGIVLEKMEKKELSYADLKKFYATNHNLFCIAFTAGIDEMQKGDFT